MRRVRWLMLWSAAVACGSVGAMRSRGSQAPRVILHSARGAASDLEVTGDLAGLAHGSAAYVSYEDLKRLPQAQALVKDDPDLGGGTLQVNGIELGELARALGAGAGVDLIDANCTDNYRAYYPAEMIAAHRPILVLTINGLSPHDWAAQTKHDDPGPYLVEYGQFHPAWKVHAHEDQPQLPLNVVRLTFERQADAFARIAPKPDEAANSQVNEGWRIAQQNCIRCHADGQTGGTKSPMPWRFLSWEAREQPERFARVVKDPKSVNPGATMEGNPGYDEATLAALSAYFKTFAEGR